MSDQLKDYFRTFILNAVFIVLIPMVFAAFKFSTWTILAFYLPAYSFAEMLIDLYFTCESKRRPFPRRFPGRLYLTTIFFNLTSLVMTSYAFLYIAQINRAMMGTSTTIISITTILALLMFISGIESWIDEKMLSEARR